MQSIPLAVLKQKERVLRLSPFAIYFLLASLRKLPEHLHAHVEGLRAAAASEGFSVEVGHVDVRVLHRRVACADDPAFRAVLAARHGDLVGLAVQLVGWHERAVTAEVAIGEVHAPRAGVRDVRAFVVELDVRRLVVVVRFEIPRVACGEGDVLREAVLAADGEDAALSVTAPSR